jgi:hypothetical protein
MKKASQVTMSNEMNDAQIKMYVLSNHTRKSIADMAKDLGIVHQQVTAKYKLLINDKMINREDSFPKPIIVKTPKVKKAKEHKSKVIKEAISIEKKKGFNGEGEYKKEARELMATYIKNSGVVGLVPSLMNEYTIIEEDILQTLPKMTFLGVDDDIEIINKLKAKVRAKKLPIKTKVGLMSGEIFGKESDEYAHLILDYCGNLFKQAKEIEYAIDNNIVKVGGIIAITISKTMRSGKGVTADFIRSLSNTISNNVDDFRCDSDRQNEAYFYNIVGRNYVVREFFHYCDTSPMTLIIIQRIK